MSEFTPKMFTVAVFTTAKTGNKGNVQRQESSSGTDRASMHWNRVQMSKTMLSERFKWRWKDVHDGTLDIYAHYRDFMKTCMNHK